jgi:integrase
MTKDEALNSFHQWLTFRNYAKGTVTDYLYNFRLFSQSLPADFDYSELTDQHAVDFVFKLRSESKWSPASINLMCSSLRCFYDVILNRPISIRRLPNVKYTLDDPKIFTDSEIALLLSSADVRLRAMIYLGFDCGLRTSEVARLRIRDIDSERMLLHVVHSKRGKSRYVKLSQQCLLALREYWKVYRPSDWLFPGKINGHIGEYYPSNLFHQLLADLHIRPEDSLSFHCLRHTYGTTMRNDDCDIFTLKKLLGHSCLSSTNRYIRVSTSDIQKSASPSDCHIRV